MSEATLSDTRATERKYFKTLDKGVVIYFSHRHPVRKLVTNIKTDPNQIALGNTIQIGYVEADKSLPYADLTRIDVAENQSAPFEFLISLDVANIKKAHAVDELTEDILSEMYDYLNKVMIDSYSKD